MKSDENHDGRFKLSSSGPHSGVLRFGNSVGQRIWTHGQRPTLLIKFETLYQAQPKSKEVQPKTLNCYWVWVKLEGPKNPNVNGGFVFIFYFLVFCFLIPSELSWWISDSTSILILPFQMMQSSKWSSITLLCIQSYKDPTQNQTNRFVKSRQFTWPPTIWYDPK